MFKSNPYVSVSDLDKCVHWINDGSFKKISLEIPEHMLEYSADIALYLQKRTENTDVWIIGDRIYDSACSDKLSHDHIDGDAAVHFGQACLSCDSLIPTYFVFPKESIDVQSYCKLFCEYFQDVQEKILFFYDTSYACSIDDIYECLKVRYNNLIFTQLICTSNASFSCPQSAGVKHTFFGRHVNLPPDNTISAYSAVFLGPVEKTFNAMALSIPAKKWYYVENSVFTEFNSYSSKFLKRRSYLLEKIRDAQKFGLLIASLNMTGFMTMVDYLKTVLEKMDKRVYVFTVGQMTPSKLANFDEIDLFVAVACPENSLIDSKEYYKPIVLPYEVELAFNENRTQDSLHIVDFKCILPGASAFIDFEASEYSEPSLVSGNMRSASAHNKRETNTEEKMEELALVEKSTGTLSLNIIEPSYLKSRHFIGLEQKLGQTEPSLAVEGRDGIPINYANEKN
ncbi:hypothetical protein TKK_0000014 [Trichogramma kaykai]|uniref:2-(3-amino-3-carboxypropyl)histidine synthase subunit 2 n=1 Tax=Trichogramma kaykai TaxID=54128 RepID=A0ABD2VV89_9HYME